jgi:glucose-1-phosphate thymidylyltransferase
MKALLIAGGNGTRLAPNTVAVNKHLLPIFDKPLIFYSLSTLMLAGIRDIRLVIRSEDAEPYRKLLGDGSAFGVNISFGFQDAPRGIPDTILVSRQWLNGEEFALALGDNIYFGSGLSGELLRLAASSANARVLLKRVTDPSRFGIAWTSDSGEVVKLEEKPSIPTSNLAVTGLYFFPESGSRRAELLKPSRRGELEITDLLTLYMENEELQASLLPRGTMWLDTGTIESMMEAAEFVQSFQSLSGQLIGSPHEVGWRNGWINDQQLSEIAARYPTSYGEALARVLVSH